MSTSPYNEAGKLLSKVLTEHKSLKTIAFSKQRNKNNNKSSSMSCSKTAYAQVCQTLQHKSIIDSILNYNNYKLRKNLELDTTVRNKGLVYILLFELLFGKYQSIRGGGKLKRSIVKFEKDLRHVKSEVLASSTSSTNGSDKPIVFPRYIRVNTLKITMKDAVQQLQKYFNDADNKNDKNNNEKKKRNIIYADPHVPDLLVTSPYDNKVIKWHENELVTSGKIILQDKSSCFSALALVQGRRRNHNHDDDNDNGSEEEGDYIDACASPGNKTSHLAALVQKLQEEQRNSNNNNNNNVTQNNAGKKKKNKKKKGKNNTNIKIFAIDRASARISILQNRMEQLIPSSSSTSTSSSSSMVQILPMHQDFLKMDPKDKTYKNVKSILLDPSCSGSGIVNTPDRMMDGNGDGNGNDDDKEGKQRIRSLSSFQCLALKHAMSFPQVSRIVYSTCSVHEEENEQVVASVLQEVNTSITNESEQWQLVSPLALQDWKRRGNVTSTEGRGGLLTEEQTKCLIRADGLDGDETNGFFVSYFERKGSSVVVTDVVEKEEEEGEEGDDVRPFVKLVPGVESFYSGEFRDAPQQQEEEIKEKILDEKKEKNDEGSTQKDADGNEKLKKKLAKKRAKKIQWKRKQKEAKFARLKKKESSTEEEKK